VLFLNHVLMQEPEAQTRLAAQQGRALRAQWRGFSLQLAATPAGLLELAPDAKPDLLLTMADESPGAAVRNVLRGERPPVRIEGDVQFAAVVSWLVENVRWDVEEDLARLIGDAPAHTLAGFARAARGALQKFVAGVQARMPGAGA
jgi:ubiquinone biosynthesis protein UbiJ